MASTYSALKIELIATGEQSGTWGATTNVNLGDAALGEAITGSADVAFSSADVTITLVDTNATQSARNLRLNLTGTSGGARNLILGSGCQIEKLYLVNNGLADAVTVKNTTGTGIAVAAGKTMFVYNNGTNVVDAITHLTSLTTGVLSASGATTFTAGTASTSTTTGTAVITGGLGVSGRVNAANFDGIVGANTAAAGSFTTINASTSITNAGLTSGRVTYAGASGLLSDSANLTWDGSKLDVVNSSASGTGAVTTVRLNHVGTTVGDGAKLLFTSGTSTTGGCAIAGYGTALNAADMIFYAGGNTEKLRLTGTSIYTASGVNVGIGTSSPSQPLTVNGVIASIGPATALSASSIFMDYNTTSNSGRFAAVGNTTGTAAPIYFSQYSSNASVGRDAVIIDSSGNVGIGTSSPVSNAGYSALTISNTTGAQIYWKSTTSVVTAYAGADSNGGYLATSTSHPLIFRTVDTERMRIDTSGNLLVGTTSTTVNPGIVVYGGINNAQIQIGHASGVASGEGYMGFQYNGSAIGSITQNGTTGVLYNIVSDQRLKTNIVDAPSSNIDDIKVRSFDWLSDGSHQEYGMVAQELIEVAPYAVTKPVNPDEMMQVDYSKLVPMMIKEIQDLKQRILTLENK